MDKTLKEMFRQSEAHGGDKHNWRTCYKLLREKKQLKNTDKEMETNKNDLETLGQELQDKTTTILMPLVLASGASIGFAGDLLLRYALDPDLLLPLPDCNSHVISFAFNFVLPSL